MGQSKYAQTTRISGGRPKWTGRIILDQTAVDLPRTWKKGRLIFVNSMSDLFHDDVPVSFIKRVFKTMQETPQHTYQVLTKRAERLQETASRLKWPENVWMGVSVESEQYWSRVAHLKATPAAVRFLSLEPLLGPIGPHDLRGIHWIIAGGESGPKARPVQRDWIRAIRDTCLAQGIAFHFKQWGGVNKKATGRTLDGRTWDELPSAKRHEESNVLAVFG
jgi:protein gp37